MALVKPAVVVLSSLQMAQSTLKTSSLHQWFLPVSLCSTLSKPVTPLSSLLLNEGFALRLGLGLWHLGRQW